MLGVVYMQKEPIYIDKYLKKKKIDWVGEGGGCRFSTEGGLYPPLGGV